MKKLLLLFFVFILAADVFSQYNLDTLSSRFVGPGVKHSKISVPAAPWTVDILEVDLKNPYIKIETVKAKDKLAGNERTSSMAARNSYDGHLVVGAINGDFYNTANGVPINIQVDNGEVLRNPIPISVLGFDLLNKPMINIVSIAGEIITKNGKNSISGFNQTRAENQLILFNSFNGLSTGTNQYGTEVLIRPIDQWIVNDTMLCIVENIAVNTGSMSLSSGRGVLSGHGTSAAFLNANVHTGDTIKVVQKIYPALDKIKEVIGGFPKIVYRGENYADEGYREEGGPSHTYERNPRTAAGFNADSSKLFLFTVDGRQKTSVGMTLPELADLMIQVGVEYGINFDGGGSTTMLVRDKIENVPSDGSERAVSNALLVISTAPKGSLNSISVSPGAIKLFKGDNVNFSVTGFDEYFNPVSINTSLLEYSCDPIGTITSTGLFQAGDKPDTGYVYIKYNNFTDSALVIVKGITKIALFPKKVTTDSSRTITFKVTAYDMDSAPHTVDYTDYFWSTSDEALGIISNSGLFSGKSEGTVFVIADYNGIKDTAEVTVKIGKGTQVLDIFDSTQNYSISGLNMDMPSTKLSSTDLFKTAGAASLKLDYQYTGQSGKLNYVYLDLKTQIPVYGVPEYVYLDVKSDSLKHRFYYIVEDDNGEQFRVNANKYAERAYTFDTIPCPFKAFSPLSANSNFYFPISLSRIEIQIAGNKTTGIVNTGTIYIDNLRVKYAAQEETGVIPESENNLEYILEQNYPNPFNPVTIITFTIPDANFKENIQLRIYDVLGRQVDCLIDRELNSGIHKVEWNASGLPSGVYLYRIDSGKYTQTRKMLLLK